eukprot:COSAG02_NODE_4213_length_5624_cov_2.849412_3_plen_93_part_00
MAKLALFLKCSSLARYCIFSTATIIVCWYSSGISSSTNGNLAGTTIRTTILLSISSTYGSIVQSCRVALIYFILSIVLNSSGTTSRSILYDT